MTIQFNQLVNIDRVRHLLESHHLQSGMAYGLCDVTNNSLVTVGWQDICVQFHRINPITAANCRETNAYLLNDQHVSEGHLIEHRCKNGMIDVALPIVISGTHVATLYAGQFFYDDDPPDPALFRNQAEQLGFDVEMYLAALARVPLFSRECVRNTVLFLGNMLTILSETGLGNLKLVREMEERQATRAMLENERLLLQTLIQTLPDPVWFKDVNGVFVACNAAFGLLYDDTPSAIVGRNDNYYVGDDLAGFFQQKDREAVGAGYPRTNEEWVTFKSDGHRALWETTKTPVFDALGRVVGVLGVARDITNHKRLEEQLRTKEQYQQALLDNFPYMVWLKDTDSRLLAVNRPYLEVAGLAPDAPYFGKTDLDLFPVELAESYHADDREVMRTRQKKTREELIGAQGMQRLHETYKAPVLAADGKLLGTVGFARDITERRQLESALAASEREFRTLAENAPDSIVRYDCQCRRTYANARMLRLFGVDDVRSILNTGPEELHFEGQKRMDTFTDTLKQVLKSGTPDELEIEVRYPSGEDRIHNVRFVAERDGDGTIIGALAIGRDITERKRAEEALREREQQFRTLTENSPNIIVRYDRECRRIYANPAYTRETGVPLELMLNSTLDELWRADFKMSMEEYRDRLRQVMDSGNPTELILELQRPDTGQSSIHIFSVVPERDRDGRITGCLAIGHNITERRKAERALRKKRDQLAAVARELSVAEERERLRIASVLHDHIGQILLLGRMKLGALAAVPKPAVIGSVIDEVRELLDQATNDAHSLAVQLNPPLLSVSGLEAALQWLGRKMESDYALLVEFFDDLHTKPLSDELRSILYQCARELLINTAKHAKTDRARVSVSREGGMYCLTVEDHGTGFDVASVAPDMSRECRLGLFSIQVRIERLGGNMDIESSPGNGTCITMRLPVKG